MYIAPFLLILKQHDIFKLNGLKNAISKGYTKIHRAIPCVIFIDSVMTKFF